ncbi:MAG: sulfotransferase domain-containing protein, partial [Planctomycetota bacterium]
QQWYAERDVPAAVLFVRYEDLHASTEATLRRVLNFAGLHTADDATIRQAVEYCAFDRLKKAEASGRFGSEDLTPGHPQDAESYKVRRGKVGGFTDYLSDADIAYIDERINVLGCPLTAYDGREIFDQAASNKSTD